MEHIEHIDGMIENDTTGLSLKDLSSHRSGLRFFVIFVFFVVTPHSES